MNQVVDAIYVPISLNLGLWDDQGREVSSRLSSPSPCFFWERLQGTVQVMMIHDYVPSTNQLWQQEIPHKRACKDVFLDEWVTGPFAC